MRPATPCAAPPPPSPHDHRRRRRTPAAQPGSAAAGPACPRARTRAPRCSAPRTPEPAPPRPAARTRPPTRSGDRTRTPGTAPAPPDKNWSTPGLVETRFSPDALVWVAVVFHGTAAWRNHGLIIFPLLLYRTSVQLRRPAAPPGGGLCPSGPRRGLGHLLVGHP